MEERSLQVSKKILDRGLNGKIVQRRRPDFPGQPVDIASKLCGEAFQCGQTLAKLAVPGLVRPMPSRPSCRRVSD